MNCEDTYYLEQIFKWKATYYQENENQYRKLYRKINAINVYKYKSQVRLTSTDHYNKTFILASY